MQVFLLMFITKPTSITYFFLVSRISKSLDLQNRDIGVQSLPDSPAQVYSDGTVVWKRGGNFKAFCSFVGLGRMPFDTTGCQLIFSDTALSNIRYNLVDFDTVNTFHFLIQ